MNVLRRPGPVQTTVFCLLLSVATLVMIACVYRAYQITVELNNVPNVKYYDCVREQLSLAIKDRVEVDLSTCKFEKVK